MKIEIKTKLNLKTNREEQECNIAIGNKVVYSHKAEIINGKVKIL